MQIHQQSTLHRQCFYGMDEIREPISKKKNIYEKNKNHHFIKTIAIASKQHFILSQPTVKVISIQSLHILFHEKIVFFTGKH